MNKKELLDKYNLVPLSIRKQQKIEILNTKDSRYVVKKGNHSNIYDYFILLIHIKYLLLPLESF